MSYSHAADGRLAPALQTALHRFGKPWYALRAMKVFRDQTSLSATPELWPSVEAALADSRHFLLFASPEAAASRWVGQEVCWWLEHRSVDKIFLLVTDGEVVWEDDRGGWDWDRTTCLPEALRGAFEHEPLWVDLRWARQQSDLSLRHSRFRAAVLDVAAPLHNKPKDELDGEDVTQHRRFRQVATAVGVLLAVLIVVALFAAQRAIRNAEEAERQRRTAVSRLLASESTDMSGQRLDRALLLAVQATRENDTFEARRSLLAALSQTRAPSVFLHHGSGPVTGLSLAPSGSFLAASTPAGVMLWDLDRHSGRPLAWAEEFEARRLVLGDDGRLVAVDGAGTIVIWPTTDGEPGPPIETGHSTTASWQPRFDPRGALLLTAGGDRTDEVVIWDARSGRIVSRSMPSERVDAPTAGAVAAGGEWFALGSETGSGIVWQATTGEALTKFWIGDEVDVTDLAFAPDGTRLAAGGRHGEVLLVDPATPEPRRLNPLGRRVEELLFSPSGRKLLTRDEDGRVLLRQIAGKQDLAEWLNGFQVRASSMAFGTDDETVMVGAADGSIALWRLDDERPTAGRTLDRERWSSFDFAGKSGSLVAIGDDGALAFWSGAGLEPVEGAPRSAAEGGGLALSPDGALLAIAHGRAGVLLASAATGETVRELSLDGGSGGKELQPHPRDLLNGRRLTGPANRGLAFSPGGRILAMEGTDGRIHLWDTAGGEPTVLPSPKARGPFDRKWVRARPAWVGRERLAGAYSRPGDSMVVLWDTAAGEPVGEPLHERVSFRAVKGMFEFLAEGEAVAASADGRWLAAGSFDEAIKLWDLADPEPVPRAMDGTVREAKALALSPDGSLLAVAEVGGRGLKLWDTASGRPLGRFGNAGGQASRLGFSSDGRWLAALEHGRLLVWEGTFDGWRRRACEIVGRNLTAAEWAESVGAEIPCRVPCPDLPIPEGCAEAGG